MPDTNAVPATPPESTGEAAAALADLRGNGPFALSAGGTDVVALRTANGWRAFQGRCPHQGALLGEGELEGGVLTCRNHRWRFDAESGRRLGGRQCLVSCPVEHRGDRIVVNTTALAQAEVARPAVSLQRRIEDLPGPRGIPLLGNALQIDPDRLHLVLEAWARQYGRVFGYRMGPRRVLVVADATLSEPILRARPETFRRASIVEPVFEEMGVAGVFSAEGAAWRSQRRLAMEALSHRHLRGFYATLEIVTRRLRARWSAKAAAGATLDIAEELKRFTVDVTTTLTFGHDVNTIEQEEDVIQRRLGHVFPALNRRLFALFPTWRWVRMPKDRRLDRALAELRAWLGERIAEARARLAHDPQRAEQPGNFLESMIAARDTEGRAFPDSVIFGNAMTMLLAGEDTTAYTLAWAVHHLCDAPAAVERLRAESDALLGREAIAPDIETANRLAWAAAVANETMRLRPVAPLLFLEARQDVAVGDLAVPRGTWVCVLTRPPAVDDGNFADPDAFRPERWVEDRRGSGAHEPSAHMPFGAGPRICPGRTLALLEMKMVLAMLFGTFDVERATGNGEVREQFAFTMTPDGVRVRLRPRAR